jgi:hypothetical protein
MTVATLDMASTSSFTFGGSMTLEATVALLLRAGAFISGDGGGNSAGVGCGTGTASSGGSYGGLGSIGYGGGSAMVACGSFEWPVTRVGARRCACGCMYVGHCVRECGARWGVGVQ